MIPVSHTFLYCRNRTPQSLHPLQLLPTGGTSLRRRKVASHLELPGTWRATPPSQQVNETTLLVLSQSKR